jgi:outer membrane lipoprotein SlyB
MQPKTKWLTGAAVAVALVGGGTGVAVAATSGDDEQPLSGSTLDRAVVETEAGDDGAAYSVEVRLDDGSQVEVNLDRDFTVIGHEADDDGPNDQEGENDDD